MRLSFAALASTKLPSTDRCSPCTKPTSTHCRTILHEQLLEQLRFLKPSVPVLGERGVVRNLLIEAQPGEPAPCQMHAQFFYQPALAGNAVQITDQQNAQQQLGINRGPSGLAVAILQLLPHKLK